MSEQNKNEAEPQADVLEFADEELTDVAGGGDHVTVVGDDDYGNAEIMP